MLFAHILNVQLLVIAYWKKLEMTLDEKVGCLLNSIAGHPDCFWHVCFSPIGLSQFIFAKLNYFRNFLSKHLGHWGNGLLCIIITNMHDAIFYSLVVVVQARLQIQNTLQN